MSRKHTGDGDSSVQKYATTPLPDVVRPKKKSSTSIASDRSHRTTDKGGDDQNIKTSNKNLAQDKETDDVHTDTS